MTNEEKQVHRTDHMAGSKSVGAKNKVSISQLLILLDLTSI